MKALILLYTILLSLSFFSCKKDKNNKDYITFSACKNFTVNTQTVNVCFENVVSDSRCPEGGDCIWEGCGIVALKVTMGAETHTIQLSTLLRKMPQIPSIDTTINNVKIKLEDLTPYPCLNCHTPSTDNYKVKLKLTEV